MTVDVVLPRLNSYKLSFFFIHHSCSITHHPCPVIYLSCSITHHFCPVISLSCPITHHSCPITHSSWNSFRNGSYCTIWSYCIVWSYSIIRRCTFITSAAYSKEDAEQY